MPKSEINDMEVFSMLDEMGMIDPEADEDSPVFKALLCLTEYEKDVPDFEIERLRVGFFQSLTDFAAEELQSSFSAEHPEISSEIESVQRIFTSELVDYIFDYEEIVRLEKWSFRSLGIKIAFTVIESLKETELCKAKGINDLFLAERLNLLLGSIINKLYKNSGNPLS